MKEAIDTRELIVLDGLDVITRGTYHKTSFDCSGARPKLIKQGSIGVLFLNSPSPTRAAQGDSAVYWADSFAELGYPSFRLDLPGFGDSEGDSLSELPNFIPQGGYAPIATAKIRELVTRFNLEGVVIVEQRSNSISALYEAACCPECKGLVLMDPCFDIPQATQSTASLERTDRTTQGCRRLSRNIRGSAEQLQIFQQTSSLETSGVLQSQLTDLTSAGFPILIFKKFAQNPGIGEIGYFKYIVGLAGRKSQIVISMLEGTNRSFTSRLDRLVIRRRIEQWLNSCFPLARRGDHLLSHILKVNE